ncbi:MAG: tyrosine-type recombinase/integrase [Halobacteriota archaeon]
MLPHTFRHSFAINVIKYGCDLQRLKLLLGHSNINITWRPKKWKLRLEALHSSVSTSAAGHVYEVYMKYWTKRPVIASQRSRNKRLSQQHLYR